MTLGSAGGSGGGSSSIAPVKIYTTGPHECEFVPGISGGSGVWGVGGIGSGYSGSICHLCGKTRIDETYQYELMLGGGFRMFNVEKHS